MNYQFKNASVEFLETHMIYNGNRIDYKDIASVKNHRSEGHIYAAILITNSSIMQTIFQLVDGSSFVLEQKARSFYGIGTNGALKRKWRSMTETLQINNQGNIAIGQILSVDGTGIAQVADFRFGKTVPANHKLAAENYDRAEFDNKGYLFIYDKSGNRFIKQYAYLFHVGNENSFALPTLFDHLYKGKVLPE
jgi:hypothetical protein